MTTIHSETDPNVEASNALHHILTQLNVLGSRSIRSSDKSKEWDPETWIVFHNLIILLSLRKEYSHDDWCLQILRYTGGIVRILHAKEDTGVVLKTDHTIVLNKFFEFAGWNFFVGTKNDDEVRIVNEYRALRNYYLKNIETPFSYLLIEAGLEITGPYIEGLGHIETKYALEFTAELLGPEHPSENYQFEAPLDITADHVENKLFEYYQKKGYTTESNGMNTGSVYDKDGNLITCTSITVTECNRNSIVLVTLSI